MLFNIITWFFYAIVGTFFFFCYLIIAAKMLKRTLKIIIKKSYLDELSNAADDYIG